MTTHTCTTGLPSARLRDDDGVTDHVGSVPSQNWVLTVHGSLIRPHLLSPLEGPIGLLRGARQSIVPILLPCIMSGLLW